MGRSGQIWGTFLEGHISLACPAMVWNVGTPNVGHNVGRYPVGVFVVHVPAMLCNGTTSVVFIIERCLLMDALPDPAILEPRVRHIGEMCGPHACPTTFCGEHCADTTTDNSSTCGPKKWKKSSRRVCSQKLSYISK
jgi:hypothetical protein